MGWDEMKVTIKIAQGLNELYNEGLTLRQVGVAYGLDKHTVGNYIWNPRKNGRRCKREVL
jgi:hypothetical protein